jgi:hypothetical protein
MWSWGAEERRRGFREPPSADVGRLCHGFSAHLDRRQPILPTGIRNVVRMFIVNGYINGDPNALKTGQNLSFCAPSPVL